MSSSLRFDRRTFPLTARGLALFAPTLGALVLAGAASAAGAAAGPLSPPDTEEVQEAYARFLTGVVGKLEAAGAPVKPSAERQAQISVFARRMRLRGCDDRADLWQDPFTSADAAPPVVFHCTWENGERISLTRSPNTGAWSLADDATAAAGAGVLLVGPKVDAPTVVAVPVVPSAPKAEEPTAPAVASAAPPVIAPVMRPTVAGTHQAMPNPYVPPVRPERPVTLSAPPPASAAAMPTPYAPLPR